MFLFENEAPWQAKSANSDQKQVYFSNLSRRSFLKRSTLAASSTFILGWASGCQPAAPGNPDEKVPAQGTFTNAGFKPNVFVGLNDAGDVFIVCSRSEMGQGIRTGMPPVIADELEADWNRVHVIQADGDAKYGDQNTDGSRSVRNHFTEWRQAGATARAMLVAAAAQTWGVPAFECVAANHVVTHTPSDRTLGYGELATAAAVLDVPTDVKLKSRDEWRYIGTPMRGIDNKAIATGTAVFGIDAQVPGMVYASIERCPVIGGRLVSYDDTTALSTPGVRQVIQLEDAPLPPAFRALGGLAVVGDNTWATFQGRKVLEIEWDMGPNAAYNSTDYRATLERSASSPAKEIRSMGDITPAFASAEQTVEGMYYVPMLAHAPMEPPNALAWVKDDGTCEIWAPTQDPQTAKQTVAQILELPPENVTVHVTMLGGGFGRKSKPDFIVEAALVSKAVRAPVKLTWTREDEIHFDYFHAPSMQYLRAALDAQGKPTAWLHRTTFPSISSTFAPDVEYASNGELGLGFTTVPFDIPNMRCENGPASAHVRIGWLRSVSNIHHAFAVNAFAGEMARAAGRDQKDYLLDLIGPDRNLNHLFEGETGAYGEDLTKHPYETSRLRNVVELAAEKANWGSDLPEGHALGIAVHYSFVAYVAQVVHASVENNQVRVHRVDCAVDCGTYVNPDRVKAQMEGAVVFGLSLALHGNITAKDGAIEQSNFHDYPLLRLNETPEIHVHLVESEEPPGGVGEPGVPPVAPALTNALMKITGSPIRELPIRLA